MLRAGTTTYVTAGSGSVVVLAHGVGMCRDYWGPQIARFSRKFRVVAYDLLGHGGSPTPPPGAEINHYVNQLRGLLDALSIERAAIVGHSTGGLVAIGSALAEPLRVTRFVALNTVYERTEEQHRSIMARFREIETGGPAVVMERTLKRWFGEDPQALATPVALQVRRWLQAADPTGYIRTYRVYAEGDRLFSGKLQSLPMPVLYATGELDPNSTPEMSERMAADTPLGEAAVIPGERHMMSYVSPAAVDPLIEDFLVSGS